MPLFQFPTTPPGGATVKTTAAIAPSSYPDRIVRLSLPATLCPQFHGVSSFSFVAFYRLLLLFLPPYTFLSFRLSLYSTVIFCYPFILLESYFFVFLFHSVSVCYFGVDTAKPAISLPFILTHMYINSLDQRLPRTSFAKC